MDLYHALNRGVDKRSIFLEDGDRVRFIHDLYIFNQATPANNTRRTSMNDLRSCSLIRKRLVDIHGWCLMDNHYHLLLSEKCEGGLTLFLRKLNVGYSKYFNEKYDREGTLFQGRTKKILINTEGHFLHILNYIHLNPLDLQSSSNEWREGRINNFNKALSYLETYRWSSYLDYCGIKNFPSILNSNFFQEIFTNYRKEITHYVKDLEENKIFKTYFLE